VSVAALFVYGTLKPGRCRWPLLLPFVDPSEVPTPAVIRGRLWDTGRGWPAVTVGDSSVSGFVVHMRADVLGEGLALLDEVEGVSSGLFNRVRSVTQAGAECWVYVWPSITEGFVELDHTW